MSWAKIFSVLLKSVERRACEKICLAGLSERENHSLVRTFLYFAHVSVGTCFVLGSHRSNIAVLFLGIGGDVEIGALW